MTSGRDSDRHGAEKSGGSSDDRGGGHGTSRRGFASMDEDKQREIASKGGKAAHEKGTAHEFDSKEAREAGKAAHEKGNAHEFTPDEAREAGRKGGHAAHEKGTTHEFMSSVPGRLAKLAGKGGNLPMGDMDEVVPTGGTPPRLQTAVELPGSTPRPVVKAIKTSSGPYDSGQAHSPPSPAACSIVTDRIYPTAYGGAL